MHVSKIFVSCHSLLAKSKKKLNLPKMPLPKLKSHVVDFTITDDMKLEFSPGGEGRSGPRGPLLPERNLTFLVCFTYKRLPVLTYQNFVLRKLCYFYAPLRPHLKWLCYFVPYGHGKLDLRFVHGRTENCI